MYPCIYVNVLCVVTVKYLGDKEEGNADKGHMSYGRDYKANCFSSFISHLVFHSG